MKFNKFLISGITAGVIGTYANIALSTPINQPHQPEQTTEAYIQSSQNEIVNEYFYNQEDITTHGIQTYDEYSKAVKANGQTPFSPKVFFENPQFKQYETNLHQTENYLALQGVPQSEIKQKSIAMVHAEAANFIQAKDLGEVDSSIYRKQVEKYTQTFADSGLQHNPELYANYKVLHPELNDAQVIEKADNSLNKLNSLSKFEQIKFMFSSHLEFMASEPRLTVSTIGGALINKEPEVNYKYAKFLSEKLDALDVSAPKSEITVASIEDRAKDFSSAISLNFEGLMNKAKSFFEDKIVQSAEIENKGTKNKM